MWSKCDTCHRAREFQWTSGSVACVPCTQCGGTFQLINGVRCMGPHPTDPAQTHLNRLNERSHIRFNHAGFEYVLSPDKRRFEPLQKPKIQHLEI